MPEMLGDFCDAQTGVDNHIDDTSKQSLTSMRLWADRVRSSARYDQSRITQQRSAACRLPERWSE
jgi:hypothetical protein